MTEGLPVLPAVLAGAAVLVAVGLPDPVSPVVAASRPGGGWLVGRRPAPLAAAALLLVLAGPVAAGLGLLGAAALARTWARRSAASLRRAERAGAAEALAVLSSELHSGRPAALALSAAAEVAAGPFGQGLAAAAGSGELGADPVEALLRAAPRSAAPEVLRGLAACWQVCATTGSSLAASVDRLAGSLRADEAQRLAVASELAGPRATAALLGLLPAAGIALASGLGAHPLHVLLHTPVGLTCLAVGLGLECLGTWWTGRLITAAGGER